MMHNVLCVVSLLLFPFAGRVQQPESAPPPAPVAADSLKLPAKLECKRDHMIGLKAGSSAKRVTWEIPSGVDFLTKPVNMTAADAPGPVRVEMGRGTGMLCCACVGD